MAAALRRQEHYLAAPASRFVGRATDMTELSRLFTEARRLVTIWGPGGMGKTRLAVEFALAHVARHPDHVVWLCELSEARDLKSFCGAVARGLGAALAAGKKDAGTVSRIGDFLASQGTALVVLDNLEQVVEDAAPALGAWLRAAPEVRFLVTSRERTRLPGEVSYELSALGLPEPGGAPEGSEAVQLFLDRASAVAGKRPLGSEGAPLVAALVRKLEGIPLAIELAAARADVLGLESLLARLERRLDLLGKSLRGVEARQATMRNAVEWSWDLLDEDDRRALARFSVFRGGFSLAAADAVLAEPALDRVESLRDKSLLRTLSRGAASDVRFSLYEAVRELSAEKLAERGETDLTLSRHAAHYLAEGEAHAAAWERTGSVETLDRLASELENLLAVVDRALASAHAEEALRALLVIDPVLATRGPFGIHLELLDRALDAAQGAEVDPLLTARALSARGRARFVRGQDAAGLDDLMRARERAAALGAPAIEAHALTELGVLHHGRREMDRARFYYEEALALHKKLGNRRAEGRVLGNLGAVHHDEGRLDEAVRHYDKALSIAAVAGDARMEGFFSTNAGSLEQERGAAAQARRRYERAVTVLEAIGDQRGLAVSLGNLGVLHHEEGRLDEARAHHARAAKLLREVGDRHSEALAEGRLGAALAALDQTEEARAALDRADRLVAQGDPLGAQILSVTRGFLDLALSRSARVEGRAGEAAEHLSAARRRIEAAREGAARSDDIRLLLRILDRNLSVLDEASEPSASGMLLSPEARWCRPPGGEWQDLRDRHAVRRILLGLVERQRSHPGRGLSLAELQEAGWPGERILPQAASNRIYVAMNQLRKMGLKDALKKSGEGYYLDPALPVHYTSVDPVS
jgi:predicted ATPase